MVKQPKTEGLEWLIHSLMAFNGTGYADMNSAEDFLESYIAYKMVKKKPDAVLLARRYKDAVLPTLEDLLGRTLGAGRQPSKNMLDTIQAMRKQFY
jgi:hypothetical protein